MGQPEFSSPVNPAQAGLIDGREVRNQLGFYLRSQGEVIVRDYYFFRFINEALGDLGTQPGLHHKRRSHVTPIVKHQPER
jgi:hypothetical protein